MKHLFCSVAITASIWAIPSPVLSQIRIGSDTTGLLEKSGQEEPNPIPEIEFNVLDASQKELIVQAFVETHDGYSADEVILNDELQQRFLGSCHRKMAGVESADCNWALMNLRKAGKLSGIETTNRGQRATQAVQALAEIAARQIQDRHQVSIDQAMCVPGLREDFNAAVLLIDDEADLYQARKAAFQLRKTRRLRPELITRIADWGREVTAKTAAEYRADLTAIPETPGIYVFSDATGYLYIGESDNLQRRLSEHLDESDRRSLANYMMKQGLENVSIEIHTFEAGSRIDELAVRRAYESELIRSRNPRFNIRP